MTNKQAIKLFADMELEATVFAKKCYEARMVLERIEGSSPSLRGKLSDRERVDLKTNRRKGLLKIR